MSAREILADIILDESGNSPNGIADRILTDKRIAVLEVPDYKERCDNGNRIDGISGPTWNVATNYMGTRIRVTLLQDGIKPEHAAEMAAAIMSAAAEVTR